MIVLITGASRGIGYAMAKLMLLNPDVEKLVLTSRSADSAPKDLVGHEKVTWVSLNLLDKSSIDLFLKSLKDQELWPDVLVNNAGLTQDALFIRLQWDAWQNAMMANLNGPFMITQACFKQMLRKKWGRIINVSSVVSRTGNVGQANYVAAKSAIEGLTRALALEGARRNVTVNAIAPGFIDTDMTQSLKDVDRQAIIQKIPMGRMGSPSEIAHALDFIISAGYMTGQTLHVNGGMHFSA
ncbi:SDR family oxidoreductase [Gammaproteobacteria bacterium]|nr:SDR family oxidoreductase [Gammaproteobacteria bacterium]